MLIEDEEAQVLAAMTGKYAKLKPVYVLTLNTGLRRREMFELEWRDIDFEKGVIHLRPETTKNGFADDAFINKASRLALLEQRESTNTGKTDRAFQFSKNYASHLFSNLCKSLGNEGVTLYSLCHTFATRLGEDETPAPVHQELMRHHACSRAFG